MTQTLPSALPTAVELSAGPLEYVDTGGDGPVVVLLPGLLMDASLWSAWSPTLAARTAASCRRCRSAPTACPCAPTPTSRCTASPGSSTELLDRLDLDDVTLVGNDTGGAIVQLVAAAAPSGSGGSCWCRATRSTTSRPADRPHDRAHRQAAARALRPRSCSRCACEPLRRLPLAFGWLTKRGDAVTAAWLRPVLTQPEIRRDAVRALRAIAADRAILVEAAEALRGFDRPALVVWASEDRVMPPEHGRRLAELLPQGRLVEVDDSYTLIPLDRPEPLAEAIGEFDDNGLMEVRALTDADAAAIAGWRYPGAYATYDFDDPSVLAEDHWAVADAGTLVGYCCLGAPARVGDAGAAAGTLDVGYGMAPERMGRGAGTAFVDAVLAFAIERARPRRLRLFILEWNGRSRRVAERLGFAVTGRAGEFLVLEVFAERLSEGRGGSPNWRA